MNQPPGGASQAAQLQTPQQALANVPVYRRNGTASAMLFVSLAVGFGGPFFLSSAMQGAGKTVAIAISLALGAPLLAVCVIVLTGDVYFDSFEAPGQLKKWGVANKVVAALIVFGWIYYVIRAYI